mgnify:CR=1 FL=1
MKNRHIFVNNLLKRSNDVSVRTLYRTGGYENQSVKWLIFLFMKKSSNRKEDYFYG